MTTLPVPAPPVPGQGRHLVLVPPPSDLTDAHEHTWALRDTEYDEGITLSRFECACGGVRYR